MRLWVRHEGFLVVQTTSALATQLLPLLFLWPTFRSVMPYWFGTILLMMWPILIYLSSILSVGGVICGVAQLSSQPRSRVRIICTVLSTVALFGAIALISISIIYTTQYFDPAT
jgi:hypothetical protein